MIVSREKTKFGGVKMTETERQEIAQVPITDLMLGIIISLRNQSIGEQQIYRLFKELSDEAPDLADRVCVYGPPGGLYSEPLSQTLSFLKMGKLLELPQPNPVDQFYRVRVSQIPQIQKNLEQDDVLPKHQKLLESLAERLRSTSAA